MQNTIACEGFDLTEAIKIHVEDNIDMIKEILPSNGTVRVFLSHPEPRGFTALFKVHARHQEIVGKETHENLYKAVTAARTHLERRLHDIKDKQLSKRREKITIPEEDEYQPLS